MEKMNDAKTNDTSVIIVAAGTSSRMRGINKQLALLDGIPVIGHSMLAFQECASIAEIIVVSSEADAETIRGIADQLKISKLVGVAIGGETRQKSVAFGLNLVSKSTSLIAIHDGARPLVSPILVEKVIFDARVFGGATLGIPVKDTIKTVSGGLVSDTPDRRFLYAIQTPQVFRKKYYYEGINFANLHDLDFTDDCQLVESVGVKIQLTRGEYRNIKITTPEDIAIAEVLIHADR